MEEVQKLARELGYKDAITDVLDILMQKMTTAVNEKDNLRFNELTKLFDEITEVSK